MPRLDQRINQNNFPWHRVIGAEPAFAKSQIPSSYLRDKCVLVTGAGGSIGSALLRSIATYSPCKLVLLDASEEALYQVDRTLRQSKDLPQLELALGSVCDLRLLSNLFDQNRPQIVFHAAAYKHVPLLEQNPFAAIANNAWGTYLLAQVASSRSTEQLVLVSTDKAVEPASLMGASKRIAELILLALQSKSATRMKAVRLGNVLGSRGSVGPLFLEQIARGVPITITHSDARRYFITVEQAVDALLSALSSEGMDTILVPTLGAPIRVLEFAEQLIEICGMAVQPPHITFTTLRPGDKIEEVLISPRETWATVADANGLRNGLRAVNSPAPEHLHSVMNRIHESLLTRDLGLMMQAVQQLVPEYQLSSMLSNRSDYSVATTEATRT